MQNPENRGVEIGKDFVQIENAKDFFRSMEIVIDESGLVSNDLTKEQAEVLKSWNESTCRDLGVMMPTEDLFYKKVLLAISLWRQKQGEKNEYLLGKGCGVEVALRGDIVGRVKTQKQFPYRSHSDFEFYGVNQDGKSPYPEIFKKVFGSLEIYSQSKTKGLMDLPESLMHDTAEIVDFGGLQIAIPQLELLFLDKFMARESTPRTEGYDDELLANQYVLDFDKIHQYLDQFVITPKIVELKKSLQFYRDEIDSEKPRPKGAKSKERLKEILTEREVEVEKEIERLKNKHQELDELFKKIN